MFLRSPWLGLSFLLLAATGCAREVGTANEASETTDFTAREGYKALTNDRGGVYVSVAASGERAFLGDNRSGIDVVDLKTMKKTGTLAGRIPSESLSASGNLLAACGDRDDQPLDWSAVYGASDRNYIITLIDASTGKTKYEVALRLQAYLNSSTRGDFIDLPSMSCQLDANAKTLTVSFSQSKLEDEVVTFPLPDSAVSYDFRDIPGAVREKVQAGEKNTVKGFSRGARGLTYAAGGYGLRRVAPDQDEVITMRDEGREHLVGVAERGERLFVANHEGALLVLDANSGETIESIAVEDWVEGVAMADNYVLVVGRSGLLVTKDRWSR